MATLDVDAITLTGTEGTLSTSAGGSGDKCTPGDTTFISVKNNSGGSITVTVDSVRPSSYGTDEDLVVAIANGATKRIGPLPPNRFAGSDGLVSWTYSGTSSVTVGCFKL